MIIKNTIVLTILMELLTVFLRYGCKLEWRKVSASIVGKWPLGIRIHHGYIGVLMVLWAVFGLKPDTPLYDWNLIIGWSLFLSDLIHHFLILWPIEGNPQFDLRYPKNKK